jgi:serine/threonine protein kinase
MHVCVLACMCVLTCIHTHTHTHIHIHIHIHTHTHTYIGPADKRHSELELEVERLKRQKVEDENKTLRSALLLQSTCSSDATRWSLYKKSAAQGIWFTASMKGLDFSAAPCEGLPEAVTQAYFTGSFDVSGKYVDQVKTFEEAFTGNHSIFAQLDEPTTVRVDSHAWFYLGSGSKGDNAPDVSTTAPGYELSAGTAEAVLDLKPWTSSNPFTSTNCGEMVRYGNHVLEAQPLRDEVTMGLTDCQQVMFIRCRRPFTRESGLPFIADYSHPFKLDVSDGQGNRLLRAMLTTLFHHPELNLPAQPDKLLSTGSTCQIFSVKDENHKVIKIVWDTSLVAAEVTALKTLDGVGGVTQLHAHSTSALLLSPKAVRSATAAALQGSLAPHELAPIVTALQACHQRGVLHRDVRLDNILLLDDGTYILGDFGSSGSVTDQPQAYSTPTLLRFAPESSAVNFEPAHDLLSLVKSVYLAVHQPMVRPDQAEDVKWVLDFWDLNLVPEPWASMKKSAHAADYAALLKLIAEYKKVLCCSCMTCTSCAYVQARFMRNVGSKHIRNVKHVHNVGCVQEKELYCVCQVVWEHHVVMVECAGKRPQACNGWCHPKCLSPPLSAEEAKTADNVVCQMCSSMSTSIDFPSLPACLPALFCPCRGYVSLTIDHACLTDCLHMRVPCMCLFGIYFLCFPHQGKIASLLLHSFRGQVNARPALRRRVCM